MSRGQAQTVIEAPLVRARVELLRRVAESVLEAGFSRARFWEKGWDVATQADRLVLSYTLPEPEEFSPGVGYSVDSKTSSLALLTPGHRAPTPSFVRSSYTDFDYLKENKPRWIEDLDLVHRQWVEANVVFAHHVFGVLAADGEPGCQISDSQIKRFRELAKDLGMVLTATLYGSHDPSRPAGLSRAKANARISIKSDEALVQPEKDLVPMVADMALQIDAGCAAIFAYCWDTDTLTRIASIINTDGTTRNPPPETYSTIPDRALRARLTGHAWKDKSFRLILDFQDAKDHLPEDVDADSELWHLEVLGHLKSMLFAPAVRDGRYLLRFVNRRSAPRLPFLYERRLLDEMIANYADDLGSAILRRRLNLLRQATEGLRAASSTDRDGEAQPLVPLLEPGLRFDGISNFALLSTYKALDGVQLIGSYGSAFARLDRDSWFDPANDALLQALVDAPARDSLRAVDLTKLGPEKSPIADMLLGSKPYEFRQVAYLQLEQSDHTVYGLVPLCSPRPGKVLLDQPGSEAASRAVQTYCQLASNAISARRAQLLATGARRALGLIVHEVRIPVALLANMAESAIEQALEVIKAVDAGDVDTDFATDMQIWRRRIQERHDQVTLITRLSALLAQESVDQILQMHIRPVDLYHLVGEIADDIEYESRVDPNLRSSKVDIRGCRRLPVVNCDPDLVRIALTNIVRNAVKYSLPPGMGGDPVVMVAGSSDGKRATIDTSNFGFGIPEEIRPWIFAPFVRGEIHDQRKAIRGMGLGLFLAQRICEAHDGGVRLMSSRPVFGDQRRIKKNEGFQTQFRLWISTELEAGPHEHTWHRLGPLSAASKR